ncbi:hypothetical protein KAJ89_00015 [Candidatus Parcubacteria bacterium]|nr:hypothetical protein [Candidatus Parcubacteria bacterium]
MQKLAEISRIFKEGGLKFNTVDTLIQTEGMPSENCYIPEVQWGDIFEFYGMKKGDTQGDWQEKIASPLENIETIEEGGNVPLGWFTSYETRASRKGILKNTLEGIAVIGVTLTKDRQIVVGVRGGEITEERVRNLGVSLYGLAPGGSITWMPQKDYQHGGPIEDTMVHEFQDEIGNFNVKIKKQLGIFEAYFPGPRGKKLVVLLETDATLRQIQEQNNKANLLYNNLKENGINHNEAIEEIRNKNLPADAWEHYPFLGLPTDKLAVLSFLESQPQSFAGIGWGALYLYSLSG